MKIFLFLLILAVGYLMISDNTPTSNADTIVPTSVIQDNFINDETPTESDWDYSDSINNEDYDEDELITSDNWECTGDCSGHEAGYDWADEEGITDPSDCSGNSDSFIEGCEAYANEYQMSEDEQEYDYGYEYDY